MAKKATRKRAAKKRTRSGDGVRHLVVVFGDQLDPDAAAFDGFDKKRDAVWMAEVAHEAEYVWSHQQRIALFLAAMRHFRDALRKKDWTVHYTALDDDDNGGKFSTELKRALDDLKPDKVIAVEPGEWRVEYGLKQVCGKAHVELEIRPDRHFYCSRDEFDDWAEGRSGLRMEFFYRMMRKRHGVLMQDNGKDPVGDAWNFDKDNRESFGKDGPQDVPTPRTFKPDQTTRAVLDLVADRFGDHPGKLDTFAWPVTPKQARAALDDFIAHRLPKFGEVQDAMWTGQPFLYHARLSMALNLKLLNPREVVAAAVQAYADGDAPLNAVEGFVRQILGWREYVRGLYWRFMPGYKERNELKATAPLPDFFWTGETPLTCLREAIGQTLKYGYAHHIQRLMVTGLYPLLLGVKPQAVHEWYLAVYVDAVEWVELPNTLGMSQYGDGGLMASKPYAATGKYIQRMSNYCASCPCNPAHAVEDDACPFTTLYWDFLLRHETQLRKNQRMSLQVRNLDRLSAERKKRIRERAKEVRKDPSCASLVGTKD